MPEANLNVSVTAQNETEGPLRAAGAEMDRFAAASEEAQKRVADAHGSAGDAADKSGTAIENLSGKSRNLSAAMSAAGPLLTKVGGEMGGMAGAASSAGAQIVNLATNFAAGGPLAAGMAAIGGVIAAGTQAWKAYRFEAEQTAEVNLKVADNLKNQLDGELKKEGANLVALQAELRKKQGLEENDLASIQKRIEALSMFLPKQEEMIANMRAQAALLERAGEDDQAEKLRADLAIEVQIFDAKKTKIGQLMAERDAKQSIQVIDEKKKDEAANEKAVSEALKEKSQVLADHERAYRRLLDIKMQERETFQAGLRQALNEEFKLNEDAIKGQAELNTRREMTAAFTASRIEEIEKNSLAEIAKARDQDAKEQAQAQKDNLAAFNSVAGAFNSIGNSIVSAATAQHRQMTEEERNAAIAQVAIKTAVALASAIAAGASVPWPANIAAIASGVATVGASIAQIASFKEGGIVGGIQSALGDRDAIPIIAHRGEAVIPAEQTATLRKILGVTNSSGAFASGGVVSGGGAAQVVNFNFPGVVANTAQALKDVRKIAGMLGQLRSQGMVA